MCGISGVFGGTVAKVRVAAMMKAQHHRGPDAEDVFVDGTVALGHNRLSIIDLSAAGKQPMKSSDGRYVIAFNGEIYNYKELRAELAGYPFRTQTDTEVILAAYERWGAACLDRFIGMFAFLLWDTKERSLFAARDRFGVKPLHYAEHDGALLFASEIKALHAAGVPRVPDEAVWASYLSHGTYDIGDRTFWSGVRTLPAGHFLTWRDGVTATTCWYDIADRVGAATDARADDVVKEEYAELLRDSVRLRFRSDVPVGITLSGGLDSSTLLGVVDSVHPSQADVQAFTFVTGDPAYDESPWVEQMLRGTKHPWFSCPLSPADVPALAREVQGFEDEPFGGLPTLAYARVFAEARARGTIVLLDGQGMDEQWAGYDYYRASSDDAPLVQGSRDPATRPACLTTAFRALAQAPACPAPFPDRLRNLQYRDIRCTKIPRALRFNDRISMRSSTELREPFLDHRLVELALSQPAERKIHGDTGKWMLREIASDLLPGGIVEAPKRPLQTPQREWLRGPLQEWANDCIEAALAAQPDWFDADAVHKEWKNYCAGASDNSFYVWQWISIGLIFSPSTPPPGGAPGR